MTNLGYFISKHGIEPHGLGAAGEVFWNLPAADLYDRAIRDDEGSLVDSGALACSTGKHTGRCPKDKYFVEDRESKDTIWWGKVNQPLSSNHFSALHRHVSEYVRGKRLFVRDMFAGAEQETRVPIRVVTELAWHNLFASQLFIRPATGTTSQHEPRFTVVDLPNCKADPRIHGTRSENFVVISLEHRLVLIGGTAYAGEIKKSIFTLMNYLLPLSGILSMHCSANVGKANDVALFFGLSGTGKTTLSADPQRRLIGDDEHGWSHRGVFNIEGGCYAKCIKLTRENEPQIFDAIRFGAVLENVVVQPETRRADFFSTAMTENTRAAYPVEHITNALIPSVAGHPGHIVFLTCDAFGVLPPISRLSKDQTMYHFLSGYTAKVAGTEAGVTEPEATFSACFGAPFLPLAPEKYATMLGDRMADHKADCWLVNTGWTGGGVGVGQRIKLRHTRAMVSAALEGQLSMVPYDRDPIFGLMVPRSCPDVPGEVLTPRAVWADKAAYDAQAAQLAKLFVQNFAKFDTVSPQVAASGPKVP